jgi:ABC-2 type transport system permease protein
MSSITTQMRASYAFVERNINLIRRYWTWELVWLVYSTADCLAVSFIGLGMERLSGGASIDAKFLVLYLLIGTLVWRYLSTIFYWMINLINIERWEGTIEYTLMAPIHRMTHMAGQTFFSVTYSLLFTAVILVITALMFELNLENANLWGGALMLLAGSFSFVGIGIVASVMPLLFPERGEQMAHVLIALVLLVSGVYYPVDVLPPLLQKLAVISPATYVLEGTRQSLLDGIPIANLWPFIWPVLLMGIVLIPSGLWVFNQAERYAKRTGRLHRNG